MFRRISLTTEPKQGRLCSLSPLRENTVITASFPLIHHVPVLYCFYGDIINTVPKNSDWLLEKVSKYCPPKNCDWLLEKESQEQDMCQYF